MNELPNAERQRHLVPNPGAVRALLASLDQIHFVAITPDGSAAGHEFGCDVEAALEWALRQNALGQGVYWTVNRVRPGCHRKPGKAEIESARFAHADIDPPTGGDRWQKEQMLSQLQSALCAASFVIDSGNGLQGFWRLSEPATDWHRVEKLNAEIACRFGGDTCHNIDRLMRLPGLINFPNKRKRAAGRMETLAGWAQADTGMVYSLAELEAAFAADTANDDDTLAEWRRRTERLSDEEMIARCQRGENWHNTMIALTARLVSRGLEDADILALASRITLCDFSGDQTRSEIRDAITGARRKWAIPPRYDTSGLILEFAMSSDVATVKLEYLADPYLPKSCVVGFNGRGGAAKSSFLATIAASISRFASTLWVSAEEPRDWIKVRHIKAGGAEQTLAVVAAVPSKRDPQGRVVASSFDIYEHLEAAIVKAVAEFQMAGKAPLALVVIDTAVGLTGWAKGENPNDDASVKRLLGFLQGLAERYSVTIGFIHHANKQKHDHFADAVAGSSAWTNSPRLSFILANDRRKEYSYILRTAKSNLTQPFAVTYSTHQIHTLHERTEGADSVLCRVELGTIIWGADASLELFDAATRKPMDDGSLRQANLVEDVAETVRRLVQSSDQPITREIVEEELGRSVSRREWIKIEGELARHKVDVARGEHNRAIYKNRPVVTSTPLSPMW